MPSVAPDLEMAASAQAVSPPRALVLGASGYIGSHLVPRLAACGWAVRAAARRVDVLEARGWRGVETVAADALDAASLERVLAGVDVVYHLVHSMAAGAHFPRLDRRAAANVRDAAARAGVRRIVYLGGLQPAGRASAHLASRGETGDVLRQGPVPVTELRAGIVIGAGSAAFEVIRDLVFHLPLLPTPAWVRSRSQPIALDDVLEYLVRVPDLPQAAGRTCDVGGPEVLSYEDLIREFARVVGRRPHIVAVPVLTPRLSSYALDFVTSVPRDVARALIEGMEHDVLADDAAIRAWVPLPLRSCREAIEAAFAAEQAPAAGDGRWFDGSMLYRRHRPEVAFHAKRMTAQAVAAAPAAAVWDEVASIGGERGYYFLDTLWTVRGALDCLAGGSGMRRGRPDAHALAVGDTVDFWRVAALEPGRRLMLQAEMKLPGEAALGFEVQPLSPRHTRVAITAYFHPAGAPGLLYWHALAPVHALLFPGMARAIAARAGAAAPHPQRPRPAS
jgi:uncharacterized protein YbjT (DUF2867 family)